VVRSEERWTERSVAGAHKGAQLQQRQWMWGGPARASPVIPPR
jgi:hypothetical protein